MARTGGRNLWIAVPVVLLCIAVVAALVWLAAPMVPVAVAWAGDTLRSSAQAQAEAEAEPAPIEKVTAGESLDCRDLYPDDLWAELIWHGKVLLSQAANPPAPAAEGLVEALAPTVVLSCSWDLGGGDVLASTISTTAGDAAGIAQATLTGKGFTCTNADTALVCQNPAGEAHVFRENVWLVSTANGWQPDDYADRLAQNVWR